MRYVFKQKALMLRLLYMRDDEKLPIEGQDFADPQEENKKPSSHGEVANQQGGDFSELEESRMENPPLQRDTNGSEGKAPNSAPDEGQQDGV